MPLNTPSFYMNKILVHALGISQCVHVADPNEVPVPEYMMRNWVPFLWNSLDI